MVRYAFDGTNEYRPMVRYAIDGTNHPTHGTHGTRCTCINCGNLPPTPNGSPTNAQLYLPRMNLRHPVIISEQREIMQIVAIVHATCIWRRWAVSCFILKPNAADQPCIPSILCHPSVRNGIVFSQRPLFLSSDVVDVDVFLYLLFVIFLVIILIFIYRS